MANSGLSNDPSSQGPFSDFVIYFIIAVLFFFLGRVFDRVRERLSESRKKRDFRNATYSKLDLIPDEEDAQELPLVSKSSGGSVYKSKFEDAEKDIRKLNQTISALRETEQRLSADNTVLKNKVTRLEGKV